MASFQILVFDARRGNDEGQEPDKLLGFYPESTPLEEQMALAGLLQGLHMFSGSLRRTTPAEKTNRFEISETDLSIWATYEAEPDVFLALVAAKSWIPRHVSQDNLHALLQHVHNLMRVLFCGVQYMLDKDESGELARSSVASVLRNAGEELTNSASWLSRELRNPFTTLGHAAALETLPLPITLDVHSLCHRAENVLHDGMQLVEECLLLFNRCVLWSSLPDNEAVVELSALAQSSSIFPSHAPVKSPYSLAGYGIGTSAVVATVVNGSIMNSGSGNSLRNLQQLDSGFIVLRKEEEEVHLEDDDGDEKCYSLPFVYCSSSLKYLLAYSRGDVLLLMVVSSQTPILKKKTLTELQIAIEPAAMQLVARLSQECQAQGGELGHLPGWRYALHASSSTTSSTSTASPRSKISAMTHHARALATATSDSMSRLDVTNSGTSTSCSSSSVEVCARSTQGVWVMAEIQPGQQRRSLVVKEKKVDGDASQSISSIEASLETLGLS